MFFFECECDFSGKIGKLLKYEGSYFGFGVAMAKVTSTVSDELKEIIKEEANEEDKSQSQVVREALEHYYDQESESSNELEEKEQKIENQKKMIRDLEMKIDEIKERKNRELAKKEEEIKELEEKFEDQKESSGLFEMVKDTFSAD